MFLTWLVAKIILLATKKAANTFEKATLSPLDTQKNVLFSMIKRNDSTEYGKKYNFSSIQSIEDYQKNVPVVSYEDIRESIDKIIDGEKNILTSEPAVMFAQTSGTTGKSKFIPVTPSCQGDAHNLITRTWIYHAYKAHPEIITGKILSLVSPAVEGYTDRKLPFGSTSGHMYKNMPGIVKKAYAIPHQIFDIADYQAKYYAVMRIGIELDVHIICTANPSSILKMCEKGDEFADDIINDIRHGTLSQKYKIESEIRSKIESMLKPNPQCADKLESFLSKRNNKLLPADYWPGLALIGCWKGGSVGHYIQKFEQWLNPDGDKNIPVRDWGYLSSEARGSVPLKDEGCSGVLAITANFYEFVEVDEILRAPDDYTQWNFKTLESLKKGKEYYIFITTTGGLYRYDINDIIEVTGFYNKTPEIKFLRKGRGMTNLTGEKLSVNQVIDAIEGASKETGALPSHFKAEADSENSRYLFRIEFTESIEHSVGLRFLESIDKYLKKINIEYKAKRDSLRLQSPVLHIMKEGWYEHDRKLQVEGGYRAFQAKTQLLSPIKQKTVAIENQLVEIIELSKPRETKK